MLFQVELKEFWMEEGELSDTLERNITHEVANKIRVEIQKKIDDVLIPTVNQAVLDMIQPAIDKHIRTFITEEGHPVVKKKTYSNSKEEPEIVPFESYLRDMFTSNTNWDPKREIAAFAKKFGEDLKLQYNAAFATKIVMNLKEQGMLKDEVVNALLTGPEGKQ